MGVQEQPRGRVSADLITTLCAGEGALVALRSPSGVESGCAAKGQFPLLCTQGSERNATGCRSFCAENSEWPTETSLKYLYEIQERKELRVA